MTPHEKKVLKTAEKVYQSMKDLPQEDKECAIDIVRSWI